MKIVFAQGNPGAKYAKTRHNVGFMALDELIKANNSKWIEKSKLKAELAEIGTGQEKVILAKPTMFYNETGAVLKALTNFYKVGSKDILVIHDDLALPFGTIRTRQTGRDAGNNGVKSINQHFGEKFWRIRVGIKNDRHQQISDTAFVLGKFSFIEKRKLHKHVLPQIVELIDDFLNESIEVSSKKV
jgi:PTH1 family peptidyl-tRNA hydrolase